MDLMTKEHKKKVFLILLSLFLLIGWFYWFQWRPAMIRSYCHERIVDLPGDVEELRSEGQIKRYNALFDSCLHEKGLK